VGIDFEAEGLLDGVDGEDARAARLALLRDLERDGFAVEELREAAHHGRLPLLGVERALQGPGTRLTMAEVAERSGLSLEQFAAVNRAIGLARPAPDERVFGDADVEAAHNVHLVLQAGLPLDDLLEITRVMSRGAAALGAAAFSSVGRAFRRAGDTEHDLARRYATVTRELTPLLAGSLERMLLIHLRELARQAAVGEEAESGGMLPGAQPITVCFADLVGFTRLGESVPLDELGGVARRFDALAGGVAEPPVRLVKTIGDAAMLVSREPRPLVGAALDLIDDAAAAGDDFPALRVGVALGHALPLGGDWYGRPVNLASRITSIARPGSVLVAEELREATGEGFAWSFAGKRRLKGVPDETALYRVRRAPAD
jgi:adenylate cyclase